MCVLCRARDESGLNCILHAGKNIPDTQNTDCPFSVVMYSDFLIRSFAHFYAHKSLDLLMPHNDSLFFLARYLFLTFPVSGRHVCIVTPVQSHRFPSTFFFLIFEAILSFLAPCFLSLHDYSILNIFVFFRVCVCYVIIYTF